MGQIFVAFSGFLNFAMEFKVNLNWEGSKIDDFRRKKNNMFLENENLTKSCICAKEFDTIFWNTLNHPDIED